MSAPERKSDSQTDQKTRYPSRLKPWLFRLVALLLIPVVLLSLIEITLRIAGFGRETSYFIERTINGEKILVPNEAFGRTFFPARTTRSPNPVAFARKKTPDTFRIFIFGGSAALGDPRPGYGFPRYLEVLLKERFPDRNFEIICTAMTAINSNVVLPIARECATLDGDLWIVYMGNNEIVGPFGATGVFRSRTPPLTWIRAYVAFSKLRTFQLTEDIASRVFSKTEETKNWSGMRMFLDRMVAPDDPKRAIVNEHFSLNLRDILRAADSANTPVILGSVASNIRDLGPFASTHGLQIDASTRSEFDRAFKRGVTAQRAGRHEESIALLKQAAEKESLYAETSYRMARSHLALGDPESARPLFAKAIDTDALPFRTGSEINRIIKQFADKDTLDQVVIADINKVISSDSEFGIAGNEFFLDHVHFNTIGNYRVAKQLAETVAKIKESDLGSPASEWLAIEDCDKRLGFTAWNRAAMMQTMLSRLHEPPFFDALDQVGLVRHLRTQMQEALQAATPENVFPTRSVYESAIAASPRDYRIKENYAEFLEAVGDIDGATKEWGKIRDILPEHFGPYYHLGRLLGATGQTDDAHAYLTRALNLRPDAGTIQIELGNNLVRNGRESEALEVYETVEKKSPGNTEVLRLMADVLARLGRDAEALAKLEQSVKVRPNDWEANYLLGVERAREGRLNEAQALFEAAARLEPDNALVRLNLGVALAKQGFVKAAVVQFKEALRIDPLNEHAAEQLRVAEQLLRSLPSQNAQQQNHQ